MGGIHLAANCIAGHVTPGIPSHAGQRPFRRLPAAALPPFFAGADGPPGDGAFLPRRRVCRCVIAVTCVGDGFVSGLVDRFPAHASGVGGKCGGDPGGVS